MTSRSYFGKMNSTLRSVVPLAMFFSLVNLIFNKALQCYCSSADWLAPYRKDHPKLIKVEHSWVSERQPAKDSAKRLNSH